MAPYAIAHLKIGLKLHETGYEFESEERARVYLTNALEPAQDFSGRFEFAIPALAHEAIAVNEIKQLRRFTVVVGNPPYSNFGQLNKIPFILNLLEEYKHGLEERKLNLDDDFIKFLRLAQHFAECAGIGVIGMITNNVFIDGITHRRMRASLKASFSEIRILDLHGSSKKLETAPDGSRDENIFDIQQGVGVSIFILPFVENPNRVLHAELWGMRGDKYAALAGTHAKSIRWQLVEGAPPEYFFVPKNFNLSVEYRNTPALTDIFPEHNAGIQTKNDGFVYAASRAEIEIRIADLMTETADRVSKKYGLSLDGHWDLHAAMMDVRKNKGVYAQVHYKPFDKRWTYFTAKSSGFMARPRAPLMRCGFIPNRIMLSVRNPRRGNIDSFFVADTIVDKDGVSPFDNATIFPLYLPENETRQSRLINENSLNFGRRFLTELCDRLNLHSGKDGLPVGLTPEDVFNYIYAVLHSPQYRIRYSEFLKIDFPRIPLTAILDLLRTLARFGSELTALHLLESSILNKPITDFVGDRSPEVRKVSWSENTVWLDIDQTVGFHGVLSAVWNFHIGGYQVCEKWLKDRKGRTLSDDDIQHYQKIVVAISETIRIMAEIDEVIEQHGGWPGAFATKEQLEVAAAAPPKSHATVLPFGSAQEAIPFEYPEEIPARKAAEPKSESEDVVDEVLLQDPDEDGDGDDEEPTKIDPSGLEREDLMVIVRTFFSENSAMVREEAIRGVAKVFGYKRTGPRVRRDIEKALYTAVRRGILTNNDGTLSLLSRRIQDYERNFLKEQFVASLDRAWTSREDAIRDFARWMGYSRAGSAIEDVARSLMNGLIREGRIESEGGKVRRG
jgi:hypothetical protein